MALSKEQINIVEKKISQMENVQEVFDYLSNTFDLKNTKITGFVVGGKFKDGLVKAIQVLQPPLKR